MSRSYVPAKLRDNVRQPEDGQHILLMINHYWGKGANLDAAVRELRIASNGEYRSSYHVVAYHCHPDTTVDNIFGGIISPKGHPPIKVAAVNKPLGKARVTEVY